MSCSCCSAGGFSVFAGVGERTREGNDLYKEMIESGVIKLGEKQVCGNTMTRCRTMYFLPWETCPFTLYLDL